jgi:hypothetical protein
MKHLIGREDYIREYLRINKSIDSENSNELYEGLLGTLFGGLKMLLNKDWDNIKCKNPSVLGHLKAMDKSLSGYTLMKMQYSSECQNIRQNIADYFNDILDYKLGQVDNIESEDDANKFIKKENEEKDEEKELTGVAKILNLRDKTLLENIKKYKENISTSCKANPKLREYADQLLNSVTVFVNDIVISELEKKGADKAKLEEEKKKNEERKKQQEEEIKKRDELAKKESEEKMKKIAEDRDKAIRELGAKPIGAMDGDKAIATIASQFEGIINEFNDSNVNESALPTNYGEMLRSDTFIGIQKSLEELDWDFSDNKESTTDKLFIKVILNKINKVFEVIGESKDMFKEVPSASVQAMMIAISNAVIYGFMGDKFKIDSNEARLSLLTKCAIDSDATIGFNLPLIDDSKPDNGNFFVSIMNQFRSEKISSDEVKKAVESMSKSELKKLLKEWKIKGEANDKKDDKLPNPKDQENFAKKFGSMVMKDFVQNMSKLFDNIVQTAKKIKADAQKEREAEAAKAQQESEANEKKE